jgi:proline dehydrogenase
VPKDDMPILRSVLLRGSESRWLAERVAKRRFAQRAVRRFMPGETADAALGAAEGIAAQGMTTVLTKLGEAITTQGAAEEVTAHYQSVMERIARAGLAAEISIKPTHLGLDVSRDVCLAQLRALATHAEATGNHLWIDMESSPYVDVTLELHAAARGEHACVGVCVQSYLYRTADDLEALIELGAAIRLVKGAYAEPPDVAFPRKADVDEAFVRLGKRMLSEDARKRGVRVGLGTHDAQVIARLNDYADGAGIAKGGYEIQMLYGIRRADQARLAAAGHSVRVLISYGSEWFPWYMRRLAERPANLGFVVRSVFAG